MDNLNWGVIGFVILALVTGIFAGYSFSPSETTGLTKSECDAQTSSALDDGLFQKNAEIETLARLIKQLENKTIDEKEIVKDEPLGYLIDELYLNSLLEDTYSDREVKTLFDGEVDFDGKSYDAEETITMKDIELLANENDFEGNVYMVVPEEAIEFKLEFENDLNTSLIDEEETLEFDFLGNHYEISEWNNGVITLTKGKEYTFKPLEGIDSFTINNKFVKVISVSDEEVYVEVDGVGRTIDEDKTKTVNGLEIKAKVCHESQTYIVAVLVIAEEVESEIENGEEYEEDSVWEWIIDAHSIGITLVEDFTEIDKDGDEEFPAIGEDKKFFLPNDYISIQFNGMDEVDVEEYFLELDEKSGNEYVKIEGDFISSIEDYDKIYVNSSGIYDKNLKLIHATEIELGNTDSILDISSGDLVFEDFIVNMNLDDSSANGNSLNSEDEDWLTNFGLLIVNPEDSSENQEFEINVPEEKVSGSISLI